MLSSGAVTEPQASPLLELMTKAGSERQNPLEFLGSAPSPVPYVSSPVSMLVITLNPEASYYEPI